VPPLRDVSGKFYLAHRENERREKIVKRREKGKGKGKKRGKEKES
jgi:hypothetical protein